MEAQHKNATIALTKGYLADQSILEEIIEGVKPTLPQEAKGLYLLLRTPFRYLAAPPSGSRFRERFDPRVFYGAEDVNTACAEAGYWRLRKAQSARLWQFLHNPHRRLTPRRQARLQQDQPPCITHSKFNKATNVDANRGGR